MTESPQQLHDTSCHRCRQRKVRCNRVLPHCQRCQKHHVECVYTARVKRRRTALANDLSGTSSNTLSRAILERLGRLETFLAVGDDSSNSEVNQHNSPTNPRASTDPITHRHNSIPISRQHDLNDNHLKEPGDYEATNANLLVGFTTDTEVQSTTCSPTIASLTRLSTPDALGALYRAVHELQRISMSTSDQFVLIEEDFQISKDVAKSLVNAYIDYPFGEPLPSLINRELLLVLPTIADLPYIRVDPVMMLIYHCVLYKGLAVNRNKSEFERKMSRKIYLCCIRSLPAWQRHATGSIADFYAASFMMQTALENFDHALAWKLFTLTCKYAKALNFHQVDRLDGMVLASLEGSFQDHDRINLWSLIQDDFRYRLIYEHPPILTGNIDTWNVNLPNLALNGDLDKDHTPAIQFIVSSRLTFALSDFFHMMEQYDSGEVPDLIARTETICAQVDNLYREWNIDQWVQGLGTDMRLWPVSSIAFTGYLCIIYMTRRAIARQHVLSSLEATDDLVSKMPLIQSISRRILQTACAVLTEDCEMDTLSVLFGCFQIHLPYSYLAHRLLELGNPPQLADDAKLLDAIAQIMARAAKGSPEIGPLAWAMKHLNTDVQNCMV